MLNNNKKENKQTHFHSQQFNTHTHTHTLLRRKQTGNVAYRYLRVLDVCSVLSIVVSNLSNAKATSRKKKNTHDRMRRIEKNDGKLNWKMASV